MKDFHTAVSLCRFHLLLLQPGRLKPESLRYDFPAANAARNTGRKSQEASAIKRRK